MKRLATIFTALAVSAVSSAGEIGYIEDFSLADDRSVPLGQLIPGTEDYFYYHALHLQNNGQFGKVDLRTDPSSSGDLDHRLDVLGGGIRRDGAAGVEDETGGVREDVELVGRLPFHVIDRAEGQDPTGIDVANNARLVLQHVVGTLRISLVVQLDPVCTALDDIVKNRRRIAV